MKATLKAFNGGGHTIVPQVNKDDSGDMLLPPGVDKPKQEDKPQTGSGEILLPPGVRKVPTPKEQDREIEMLLPPGVNPCINCD